MGAGALITHTCEYALRAVVYLAAKGDHSPTPAQEISDAVRVPLGYLQKVLRLLARHGLLTVHRGPKGGFTLAKVATAISVRDVLYAMETHVQRRIERCPLGIEGHTKLCALHQMLDKEMERTERTFATTSIGDLIDGAGGIRALCDTTGRFPTQIRVDKSDSDDRPEKSDPVNPD